MVHLDLVTLQVTRRYKQGDTCLRPLVPGHCCLVPRMTEFFCK